MRLLKIVFLPLLVLFIPIYFSIFLFISIIRYIFQKKFDKVKIVCIGNITLGGSGKTVLVEKLAKDLKSLNKKISIITRGYNRRNNKNIILLPDKKYEYSYVEKTGDEAFMLFREIEVPVGIGKNKKKIIKNLIDSVDPNIIISDDGYQNFSFYKDINILLINLYDFIKPKFLFPAENLREPVFSAVKRADYVILLHTKLVDERTLYKIENKINKIKKNISIIYANYIIENIINIYDNKSYRVYEFLLFNREIGIQCGIANPKIFQRMLQLEGFEIKYSFIYPDHYWYTENDIIKAHNKSGNLPILVTRKDAVKIVCYVDKIKKIYLKNIYFVDITLEIDKGKDLWQQIIGSL
ncbi:MAG: tetraacyldisaccharide 4'-kinase [Endomicrobia bacterium]|nr:tetraacyldisaccharide 4'-kinase [Endomicrobiia bacterium]